MNQNFRNFALWAIIALLLIALFQLFSNGSQTAASREIPYSQFLSDVEGNRVRSVTIQGPRITGTYTDNTNPFQTYAPSDPELVTRLRDAGVQISASPPADNSNPIWSMLLSFGPILLILSLIHI